MTREPYSRPTIALVLWLSIFVLMTAAAFGRQKESAQNDLPPVYLNHISICVDQQTYDDIGKSDFIQNQFAGFSRSTTVSNGGETWTGTYIRGRNTYIEFFAPSGDSRIGDAGIGLGVEEEGGINIVYSALMKMSGGRVRKDLRTKKIDGRDIPWFYDIGIDDADESADFVCWVMEYHRDYMKNLYPEAGAGENGITRSQVLSHAFKNDRYFEDIEEATLALSGPEADRFVDELRSFGYKIIQHDGRRECIGPDIKFTVIPRTSSEGGITNLRLSLLKPVEGQNVLTFGPKSILKIAGKHAVWTF